MVDQPSMTGRELLVLAGKTHSREVYDLPRNSTVANLRSLDWTRSRTLQSAASSRAS